jgi:hypothetical protein
MTTPKQLAANRRNAQLSTGPRTDAGKSVSSQNALKSGLDAESQLVPGESAADFALLRTEYYQRFRPATPELRFQVDNLIRNEWLLRRFHRVEAMLWKFHVREADPFSGCALGEAYARADAQFARLQRRVTAAEKAYKAATLEIERLQALVQPEELTAEIQEMASFRTPAEMPAVPGEMPAVFTEIAVPAASRAAGASY